MFDKRVIDSDKFSDLPNSSKALYFMAGMEADDRGFFQPRKLQKEHGFTDDDYKILIAKGYFICFESGVMVVTDWNKNNWLDSRRITETEYVDELKLLSIVNSKYELNPTDKPCLADAKPSLSQYSIEENRIVYINNNNKEHIIKTNSSKKQYADYVYMKETEYSNLVEKFGENFANRCIEILNNYKGACGKKYKSDYLAILNWVVNRVEQEGVKKEPKVHVKTEEEIQREIKELEEKNNQKYMNDY